MRNRLWWALGGAAFLALCVLLVVVSMKKEAAAKVEATRRCSDPAVRENRTAEQCVGDLMQYYQLNYRLPKVGTSVSAAEQKPDQAPEARTIYLPEGEKLVSYSDGIYITERRLPGEVPRRLMLYNSSGSSDTLNFRFYIQER